MSYKKIKTKFSIGLLLSVFVFSTPTLAQLDEIKAFLEAGPDNATALTKAYLTPLPAGLTNTLNSGWVTKAAPTKKLGFSLQFRVAVAAVPSSGQTFDANDIGLTGFTVSGTSSNTISGSKGGGQTITSTAPGGASFTIPGGTGFNYVPAPMLQGNVGLIKGTDVTLRYIPEVSNDDYGDISLFGAGIKHDLTQWIPGGKLLPVDISLFAAYTKIDMNANISFNNGTGQRVETTTDTFVFNALVGKTLPFLSAYAGLGVQTGDFDLNMVGDYDLGLAGVITDPVSYTQKSDASIHALAGFQFKLGFFRIYAEATASEYVTANVGFGLGIR